MAWHQFLRVRTQAMARDGTAKPIKSRRPPAWTEGLKRLYDSVVEEPLPEDLANLLAQLDKEDPA
jgi:hypothetical protein